MFPMIQQMAKAGSHAFSHMLTVYLTCNQQVEYPGRRKRLGRGNGVKFEQSTIIHMCENVKKNSFILCSKC